MSPCGETSLQLPVGRMVILSMVHEMKKEKHDLFMTKVISLAFGLFIIDENPVQIKPTVYFFIHELS